MRLIKSLTYSNNEEERVTIIKSGFKGFLIIIYETCDYTIETELIEVDRFISAHPDYNAKIKEFLDDSN